ncbi:hypothetical protein LIER_18335 [Lithospermum erythrorhizon]|uniref:Uncharacterized protein n=1 Tax=Lithospermum erythrorhizon TaxID=34254 RepID=A0AAV3QEL3_LITER
MEGMKKTIACKINLNLGLDKEFKEQKARLEEKANRVEKLTKEVAQERDATKAWSAEKAQLEEERNTLQTEKEALHIRNEELEKAKANEANKASKALAQAKRDAEMALASTAAQAEMARINFANSTPWSFLSSHAYDKKVGSECAAYLHSLVTCTQGRFPALVSLFHEEVIRHPGWYHGLSLPEDVAMAEGGETSHPRAKEDNPANP